MISSSSFVSYSHQNENTNLVHHHLSQPIVSADFSNGDFSSYITDDLLHTLKHHQTLKILNLTNNKIDQNNALDLAEILQVNSCLTELILTDNQLGSHGVTLLLKSIYSNPKTALRKLDLSNNCIDSIEADTIKLFFENNQSLQILILNQNALNTPKKTDLTLPLLFKSLSNTQKLTYLSLQNIHLIDQHIETLISGLKENKSLQMLDLSNTILYLHHSQVIHLLESLNDKKNFIFVLGNISENLATHIIQSIPKQYLNIIATCTDQTLAKRLADYQNPSIIRFSCIRNQSSENNLTQNESLHPSPRI